MAESADRTTVTNTTGMRASTARIWFKTSRPDWSGRRRSRRMTFGGAAPMHLSPSLPVLATSTRCSGAGKKWRTFSASRSGSSSISSKFAMAASPTRWAPIENAALILRIHHGAGRGMIHTDTRDDLRQAEQELRERERQLDSLMGHLPGLAYRALADEHWTCLFVSKGIEAVTGYTPDNFTSRRVNYIDIILPDDRQATREAILTAVRERGTYEDEHRIRHKDGSIRWIWARGHGVFAPDGSLRFLEGLNLDITARKQAEEALQVSERRFRVFVDHAADAFFMTDEQGRVLDVNSRACEARGYTRDELIAMPPYDFVSDLNPTVVDDRVRRLLAGETIVFEDRYRRKDGTVFPVEVRGKAFWEGDRALIVYLPRDVADRK